MDADFASDETFYLLDMTSREIVEQSWTGGVIRRIAPKDPSYQFSTGVVGFTAAPDGRLFVWDVPKRQVISIAPDGAQTSFTVLTKPAYRLPAPMSTNSRSELLIGILSIDSSYAEEIHVYDVTGKLIDSLGPFPVTSSVVVNSERTRTTSSLSLGFDMASRTQWAESPDGQLFLGQTREYAITPLRPTAPAIGRSDVRPVRVTDADIKVVLEAAGTTGLTVGAIRSVIPQTKSSFLEILVADNFVVVRTPRPEEHTRAFDYDVFLRSTGQFCGSVTLPVRLMAFRGDRAIGLTLGNSPDPKAVLLTFGRAETSN